MVGSYTGMKPKSKNQKVGHRFNDSNERLFGNEQKLVFNIQKYLQMVGVRAKKKGGEGQRKESHTFCHYFNVC